MERLMFSTYIPNVRSAKAYQNFSRSKKTPEHFCKQNCAPAMNRGKAAAPKLTRHRSRYFQLELALN